MVRLPVLAVMGVLANGQKVLVELDLCGGESHEALERAVDAPQSREAVALNAAREELAELLLDEPREAVSVAPVRDFPEKRLQVLSDDGVVHGVPGVAGLIQAMGMPHTHG